MKSRQLEILIEKTELKNYHNWLLMSINKAFHGSYSLLTG